MDRHPYFAWCQVLDGKKLILNSIHKMVEVFVRREFFPMPVKKEIIVDIDNDSGEPSKILREQNSTLVPDLMTVSESINMTVLHDALPDGAGVTVIPRIPLHKVPKEIPEAGIGRRLSKVEMRQEVHSEPMAFGFPLRASIQFLNQST